MAATPRIIVVGGGLARPRRRPTSLQLVHADLFSIVPVKRSHSVCAGWHHLAKNLKGEGD